MGFNCNDDSRSCKACQNISSRTQLSTKPPSLHDLHNFKIVPNTRVRRENCNGVGETPSQDCDCIRTVYSAACTSGLNNNTISKDCEEALFTKMNEKYCKSKTRAAEECKSIDIQECECCKAGCPLKTSVKYPHDCSKTCLKQVSTSFMNPQCYILNTCKEKALILSCKDPKNISAYNYEKNLKKPQCLDTSNNCKENHNQNSDISYQQQYPIEAMSYSNKNCRWGGCHGPMKIKCLDDPNKKHMFRNGCEVWHCGGCCQMERNHVAYESMALLDVLDKALGICNEEESHQECSQEQQGHLKPSQMLSSPSRCEALNKKNCKTLPNIICNNVTSSNSLCPASKEKNINNHYISMYNSSKSFASQAPLEVKDTLSKKSMDYITSSCSYTAPKLPPRPCVCGNKACEKKLEIRLITSNCDKKAPCFLSDYFQKLEWEKLNKKKSIRAKFPRKPPCFLKVPAW